MARTTLLILVITLLLCNRIYAIQDNYAVDKIPTRLLKGANAVLRVTEKEIEIQSATSMFIVSNYVITVLNEDGDKYAVIDEKYDRYSSIRSIEGSMYDKNGIETYRINKGDIPGDLNSLFSEFDGERSKKFRFKSSGYPYTCIYSVVKHYSSLFDLPICSPQIAPDVSVEKAIIKVTYPNAIKLNYKIYRSDKSPIKTKDAYKTQLNLELSDLCTYSPPDNITPGDHCYSPSMVIMPTLVQIGAFIGNVSTWNNWGAFIYDLNYKRDLITERTASYIHKLTDTCSTRVAKINAIYDFVKETISPLNTNWNIGGWQTNDALTVEDRHTGDAKAITNYMHALLSEIGIQSYMALIYRGKYDQILIDEHFPFNVFNTAILCIPEKNDTIWLDCLSKTQTLNRLTEDLHNRKALLITSTGGYIVHTPKYHHSLSKIARKAIINIIENDQFTCMIDAFYTGSYRESEISVLDNGKASNIKLFDNKYNLRSYGTQNFSITSGNKNGEPYISEQVEVAGSGIVAQAGNKIVINPQVFYFEITFPSNFEDNRDSFQISFDGDADDTTIINLQGEYDEVNLPADIDVDLPSCSYHAHTVLEMGHILKLIVHCTENSGIYPGAQYTSYKELCKTIKGNLAYERVILKRKS